MSRGAWTGSPVGGAGDAAMGWFAQPEDLLAVARSWSEAGEQVAIATVVGTWGSSPRPTGSRLVLTSSGAMAGSVSGGCVESEVAEAAFEVLRDRRPRLLTFEVGEQTAWSVGLACGGTVHVFVEALGADASEIDASGVDARGAGV